MTLDISIYGCRSIGTAGMAMTFFVRFYSKKSMVKNHPFVRLWLDSVPRNTCVAHVCLILRV